MKHSFLSAALAVCVLLGTASLAHADERWPRWYVGLNTEMNFRGDSDVGGTSTGEMSFDDGYGFGASLGYMPNITAAPLNWLRLEAEMFYRSQDLDQTLLSGVLSSSSGDTDSLSYMLNAFIDVDMQSAWTPYVGGGIGLSNVQLSTNSNLGNTSDSDWVMAYQVMAGIGYTPALVPHTRFDLGYRYFATEDLSYNTPTGHVDIENSSSSVELGAKFRF